MNDKQQANAKKYAEKTSAAPPSNALIKHYPIITVVVSLAIIIIATTSLLIFGAFKVIPKLIASPDDRQYADAIHDLDAGRDWHAIHSAEQILRRNPKHKGAHYVAAAGELALRNIDDAVAQARQATVLDANYGAAHLILARCYLDKKQYENAIAEADIASRNSADAAQLRQATYVKGLSNLRLGRYEAAERALKTAAESGTPNEEYFLDYGRALTARGSNEECVAQCNKVLKLNPKSAAAYFLRADATDVEDTRVALADYEKAAHLSPANVDYAVNWANQSKDANHNYIEVIDFLFPLTFSRPSDKRPAHVMAKIATIAFPASTNQFKQNHDCSSLCDLTVLYKALGKYSWSMEIATEAVQTHPSCAEAFWRRAQTRLAHYDNRAVDVKTALADANRALDLNPRLRNAHLTRGMSNVQLGQYNSAINDLQEYLRKDGPQIGFANDRIADCYMKLRKPADALQYQTAACESEPDNEFYLAHRAAIRASMHEADAALADLKQASKLSTSESDLNRVYKTRGDIWFYDLHDFERAKKDYARYLSFNPGDVESLMDLARVCNLLDQPTESLTYTTQALKVEMMNPAIHREQAMSYFLSNDKPEALRWIRFGTVASKQPQLFADIKALIQFRDGDYAGAVQSADQAITRQSLPGTLNSVRGLALLYESNDKEALDYLQGIYAKNGTNAPTLFPLFVAEAKELGLDSARSKLKQRLDQHKDSVQGYIGAPALKFLAGEMSEPDLFREISPTLRGETMAHGAVGFAELMAGNKESARKHLLWVKENGSPAPIEAAVAIAEIRKNGW